MHTFGTSGPLKDVLSKTGFVPDKVAANIRNTLAITVAEAAKLGLPPFGILGVHIR
jgi:hypothetical protein